MGIVERIKSDILSITTNKEHFGVDIVLTDRSGQSETIIGTHSKINLGVDTDGNLVNSRKAHISFSESVIQELTIRNDAGDVTLKGWKAAVSDVTGVKTYKIYEWFPDETTGLITAMLGDYTA